MIPDFFIRKAPDGWHARRAADGWSTGPLPSYREMKAVVDAELAKLGPARGSITSIIDPGEREACDEPRAG